MRPGRVDADPVVHRSDVMMPWRLVSDPGVGDQDFGVWDPCGSVVASTFGSSPKHDVVDGKR